MKNFLLSLFVVCLCATGLTAQTPEKISYQAIVRNSSDAILANANIGMQISILEGSSNGTAVYVETQTPTTNANGLVSIEIGNGTIASGSFNAIDWANNNYFVKTEIDLNGGTSYTITGTSQLMSVPYALHAKTAENISGGISENDPVFTASEANNLTATDISNLNNLSGTNTGDQDISGIAVNATAITAIEAEQDSQDAAIALNTAKTGITSEQATIISNTSGTNTGDQDISGIAVNATAITAIEAEQDSQDAAIALNTAKTGITSEQATIISNTSGTNTGDQDISGIAVNETAITAIEAEQDSQDTAIALNTAKETNATHTGDVTGATTLTIANDAVTIDKIGTAGVTDANKSLTTDTGGNPQWTVISNNNEFGDIKTGIQNADHNGWILLDGRSFSSLSATQQAQATTLGLSGNLPNASNAYLSQNGATLGSISGSNTKIIAQNNLPNISPSITVFNASAGTPSGSVSVQSTRSTMNNSGNHNHALNMVDKDDGNFSNSSNQYPTGDASKLNGNDHYVQTETSGNHTHTMNAHGHTATFSGNAMSSHGHSATSSSINGGVTQQAINIAPRTLSVNTFIYLGE